MFYNVNPATSPYTIERTTLAAERIARRWDASGQRGYLVEASNPEEASRAAWARLARPEITAITDRRGLNVLRLVERQQEQRPAGPGTILFLNRMGQDAGNASMRKAGRSCWNEDDAAAAQAQFERLLMLFAKPGEEVADVCARLYALAEPWGGTCPN